MEAGDEAQMDFVLDAPNVLSELGCTREELVTVYHFLVERGVDREPEDGLVMLRRARHRANHIRWRGLPRRAQDHFDDAEILGRFLTDLTGEAPAGPSPWARDGRQSERSRLFERGPAARFDPEELKAELDAAELYPHGVHVAGEGSSEAVIVESIVGAVLGWEGMRGTSFSDLGGSGAAARVEELVQTLGGVLAANARNCRSGGPDGRISRRSSRTWCDIGSKHPDVCGQPRSLRLRSKLCAFQDGP